MGLPTWKDLPIGNIVSEPGSASEYRTGDWRSERPILDKEKCNKCALCWLYCPDAAIYQTEDEFFETNLYYCKGCGICVDVCPKNAKAMVEEEE